jgi:hypothetical protein
VTTALPAGFDALEPFAAYWAAETLSERDTRRLDSTEAERVAFYTAARDLAPAALDYLDSKSFADYEEADHRLLDLMLSLIHATLAIEIERDEEHVHARGARLMPIVHERADPRALFGARGTAPVSAPGR